MCLGDVGSDCSCASDLSVTGTGQASSEPAVQRHGTDLVNAHFFPDMLLFLSVFRKVLRAVAEARIDQVNMIEQSEGYRNTFISSTVEK